MQKRKRWVRVAEPIFIEMIRDPLTREEKNAWYGSWSNEYASTWRNMGRAWIVLVVYNKGGTSSRNMGKCHQARGYLGGKYVVLTINSSLEGQ